MLKNYSPKKISITPLHTAKCSKALTEPPIYSHFLSLFLGLIKNLNFSGEKSTFCLLYLSIL